MKKLASLLPDRFKLHLMRRHLAGAMRIAGGDLPVITLSDRLGDGEPLHVRLRRGNGGIDVCMDLAATLGKPSVYRMLYARLPVALRVMWEEGRDTREVGVDLTDGYSPVPRGFSFCSAREDAILIPDPVFFNSDGYAQFRKRRQRKAWSRRKDIVLWRGTSTGAGAVTTASMDPADPQLRARIRMCLRLAGVPGTDARIRKTESDAAPADHERLLRHGLLGGKVSQAAWGRYKFALDVDGHTNAWSNFFVRLLLGCCVLKVQSEGGYRQWYYERLQAWSHYVPVRADMSDLLEKIEWCRSHDADCERIAATAAELAHRMTVDSEVQDGALRLRHAGHGRAPAAAG